MNAEEQLKAAQFYADYAAPRQIEQFCDWRKGGWRDIGLAGPLVCFAIEYLRSRGRIEDHPKKRGWFRIRDATDAVLAIRTHTEGEQ